MWFDKLKKLQNVNIKLGSDTAPEVAGPTYAVFGGGCFWCTEAVFKMMKGVKSVMPGYAGGKMERPTYDDVASGTTTHAEVVRIEYDPKQISYHDLLTVFFGSHDPTTLNQQGNDIGTQYRSIILYTTEAERAEAEAFIRQLNLSHKDGKTITTEVKPLEMFYEAEEYHRDYFAKNPTAGYCQLIINPKLEKVQKEFAKLLNDTAKHQ